MKDKDLMEFAEERVWFRGFLKCFFVAGLLVNMIYGIWWKRAYENSLIQPLSFISGWLVAVIVLFWVYKMDVPKKVNPKVQVEYEKLKKMSKNVNEERVK
ncbi:MAG: hypothetical protein FWE07_07345 [Turicibacter sp.]|nr:hypothetical protein [Turicibacter sp.]